MGHVHCKQRPSGHVIYTRIYYGLIRSRQPLCTQGICTLQLFLPFTASVMLNNACVVNLEAPGAASTGLDSTIKLPLACCCRSCVSIISNTSTPAAWCISHQRNASNAQTVSTGSRQHQPTSFFMKAGALRGVEKVTLRSLSNQGDTTASGWSQLW